jgi:hypothetical protein
MTREDAEEYSSKSIHIASFAPVAGVLAVELGRGPENRPRPT